MTGLTTIGSASGGADSSADGTEKIPVSGSKYMLVSTIAAYIRTLTQTLTGKTINLTDNTLTGTTAQFNTALSDNDFATLAGAETLANKNLTAPTIADFTNAQHDHGDADDGGTIAESVITFTDITTNNVSTTKHGYTPKLDNDTAHFLNGQGGWTAPSVSAAVATDAIWDAKGDLAGGTGANTAAKLTVGSNGTILTADSGETTGLKWAVNSSTVVQATCQGRLTLTSGTTITTADVTAATSVYFAPLNGNLIALYNGSAWAYSAFTERTLSIAGLAADTNHDVFIYDNAGTITLEAVAWTDGTTRATALALQDGIYVKTGTLTKRYLGTFRTTSTIGQTEDSVSKRFLFNYYNRAIRFMKVVDTTDTWTYGTTAWQAARGQSTNKVDYVCGVADELVRATVLFRVQTGSGVAGSMGVGVDSTTVNSAQLVQDVIALSASEAANGSAEYIGYPGLGYHYLQWIEYRRTGTVTFYGDAGVADQQSGMMAQING
jgi:hypothetical protein